MEEVELPRKKYYRQRAHSNPLSDHSFEYPSCPDDVNWKDYYPLYREEDAKVRYLDVGCGYGGLLVTLSELHPDVLTLGLEIRVKVSDYVADRIKALQHNNPGHYGNIAVLRTNAMKYLPNYFRKAQLLKMFFLFPDPHFKKTNHKRRIINPSLLAEYAYMLQLGGLLYTATDVKELHEWMCTHISAFPLFERLTESELREDPITPLLSKSTEESKKVAREAGSVYTACFKRIPDPQDNT